MGYLIWFLFELITGGGAAIAYFTNHPWLAIGLLIVFIIGLLPLIGDGIGDIIGAFD